MMENITIIHNEPLSRFEAIVDGQTAVIDYIKEDNCLTITHTGVPKPLEGRGIAGAMTKFMLDYAHSNNLMVNPVCPYTQTYIQRHPEYQDIVLK